MASVQKQSAAGWAGDGLFDYWSSAKLRLVNADVVDRHPGLMAVLRQYVHVHRVRTFLPERSGQDAPTRVRVPACRHIGRVEAQAAILSRVHRKVGVGTADGRLAQEPARSERWRRRWIVAIAEKHLDPGNASRRIGRRRIRITGDAVDPYGTATHK